VQKETMELQKEISFSVIISPQPLAPKFYKNKHLFGFKMAERKVKILHFFG